MGIFLGCALTQSGVRSAIRSLLKALFSPKLLALFGAVIGTNVFFIWLLWRGGQWDPSMLYDTLFFVAVGAIGSISRAASQGVTYDSRFYFNTLFVNFEVMALFAFLSDFFPFNFWVEFLLVVPFFTILSMLAVFSEYQKDAEQVHRVLTSAQGLIGIALILYVVARSVTDYQQLLTPQALFSLFLPFVLSVLFLPLLVLTCAVFAYENAFFVVNFKTGQSHGLMRWKKRRLVRRFGLNLAALQAFRRSPVMQDFAWLKTREEALTRLSSWTADEPDVNAFWDADDSPSG